MREVPQCRSRERQGSVGGPSRCRGSSVPCSTNRSAEQHKWVSRLLPSKWLKQRPESGRDCLAGAMFARQRRSKDL